MDVLYIAKAGLNKSEELRYSLRSLDESSLPLNQVYLYGDRPNWLSANCIQSPDQKENLNSYTLFLEAIEKFGISGWFLWMSDDFFILDSKYTFNQEHPWLYVEEMTKVDRHLQKKSPWHQSLWLGYDVWQIYNLSTYNFETHTPTILHTDWIQESYEILASYVGARWNEGVVVPSSILNYAHKTYDIPLAHRNEKLCPRFIQKTTIDHVNTLCKNATFLNCSDEAFASGVDRYLAKRFPFRSRFEQS